MIYFDGWFIRNNANNEYWLKCVGLTSTLVPTTSTSSFDNIIQVILSSQTNTTSVKLKVTIQYTKTTD